MIIAIAIIGILSAIQFKATWRAAFIGLILGLKALQWILIILLTVGFANMPATYLALGFTPLSIVFGDSLYDEALGRTRNKEGGVIEGAQTVGTTVEKDEQHQPPPQVVLKKSTKRVSKRNVK